MIPVTKQHGRRFRVPQRNGIQFSKAMAGTVKQYRAEGQESRRWIKEDLEKPFKNLCSIIRAMSND